MGQQKAGSLVYESPLITDDEGDEIEVDFIDLPDFLKESIIEVKDGLKLIQLRTKIDLTFDYVAMYKFSVELSDDSPDDEKEDPNNSTVRFVLVVSDYPEIV